MANSNQDKQGNKQSGNQQNQGGGRGFASMDPERQREIAAEGGRAAHASGNAHEFTSEEARLAGSQSHKNSGSQQSGGAGSGGKASGTRGGTPEQHAEAGQAGRQSHKNQGSEQSDSKSGSRSGAGSGSGSGSGNGTRGGTPEQQAEAGRQSHKNR